MIFGPKMPWIEFIISDLACLGGLTGGVGA